MTTPLQPRPSKPALQSFEFDSLAWWGRSGIWIVAILVAAIYLMQPPYRGGRKRAEQTEAVSNARQIGFALSEFQKEYGTRPNGSTVEIVRQKTGAGLRLGTKTSNDFFRQLVGANLTRSEKMFYAKIKGAQKPDEVITGAEALKKGECGFAYFPGAKATDNPNRPLAATPMIPGTDRFDPKPFDGKAVVLKADNSVTSINIRKDGQIQIEGNVLMDPANPIWDGHPPVIAWPE